MDEEVMDDEEVMVDPFSLLCSEFIAAFERLIPHHIHRPHGRYEQAIQLALNRIEALGHVNRVPVLNRFIFLVSEQNEMALYTRCVRQRSDLCNFFVGISMYYQINFFQPSAKIDVEVHAAIGYINSVF